MFKTCISYKFNFFVCRRVARERCIQEKHKRHVVVPITLSKLHQRMSVVEESFIPSKIPTNVAMVTTGKF